MFISIRERIVNEREFELKNTNCTSNQVVLQLLRRDVRASFFLFPKKVAQVICMDTGKKIKKSLWSPEIIATSRAMKDNHKVPTWGFWAAGILLIGLIITIPLGIYFEVKEAENYKASFLSKKTKEKKQILLTLDEGDLIATMTKVYKIKTVNNENVILIESTNPNKSFTDKLNNEDYPSTSFTGTDYSVAKSKFINGMISNKDLIVNILNN